MKNLRKIAGIDVSYNKAEEQSQAHVVLMSYPDMELLYSVVATMPITMPYIPGYLSFREAPVALKALRILPEAPDLLVIDGQGYAHPRRFGLACHIGVTTNTPSIGVGKTRLIGIHDDVPPEKGAYVPLTDREEMIGYVLRSRANVKPLYVSPGHKVGFEQACELTFSMLSRYKLPEPTRIADKFSKIKL